MSSREFLAEVKRHAGDRTVLGSGDLFTARDCLDMLARTGVDGVSVARGAIGNPWIFEQARALAAGLVLPPPSLHRQRDVIAEHYRLSEEIYGPSRCCRVMRKFGIKYARLHPQIAAGARRLRGRHAAGPLAGGSRPLVRRRPAGRRARAARSKGSTGECSGFGVQGSGRPNPQIP